MYLEYFSTLMSRTHLIVMSHGINGDFNELAYLERKINLTDAVVLNSKKNNDSLSNLGIETCALELKSEITDEIKLYTELKSISFVGMSMGGLMLRFDDFKF